MAAYAVAGKPVVETDKRAEAMGIVALLGIAFFAIALPGLHWGDPIHPLQHLILGLVTIALAYGASLKTPRDTQARLLVVALIVLGVLMIVSHLARFASPPPYMRYVVHGGIGLATTVLAIAAFVAYKRG